MMSKPEPCPFCGGTDLSITRKTEDREGWPTCITCAGCGASGPWIYTRNEAHFTCTALLAEDSGWNRRKPMFDRPELEKVISKYLLTQFVSNDPDMPEDECDSEARWILDRIEGKTK
jgi:Lar family restriction alleviation protein